MPISSFTSSPTLIRPRSNQGEDYDALDKAIELYGEGRHLESVTRLFGHLFPDRGDIDLARSSFSFPQGSSRVTVRLEGTTLFVRVPVVKLAEGSKATAALRFLLTRISGSGQLHQPRLHGDEVYLEFRDEVAHLHPVKLLEVLRRMPVEADENDDWMIDQFGLEPLEREPIAPLSDDEFERARALWYTHWNEIDELLKEAMRKRSMFFLNEVTALAHYQPMRALPINGVLLSRLSAAASTYNDSAHDPMEREKVLAKCIKEMKALAPETLREELGHAQFCISPLATGSPNVLAEYLGPSDYGETVAKARSVGKNIEAAVALISTYNFLLARFSWPEEIASELQDGLAESSGKPWKEAATILFGLGRELASHFEDNDEDEDEDNDEDEDEDNDEVEES